jgi:V8-like Glu-specific endopeptidase
VGETSGFRCASTIIAPRVLLTAAHCVDPAETGDGVVFEAIQGPVLSGAPRVAVVETRFDPQFSTTNLTNGHDVGVAILKDPLNVPTVPYIRTPLTTAIAGKNIRLVGYGLNDGFNQTGAGTKRTLNTSLNSFDNVTISVGTFGSTSCNGDSGGPGMVKINGVETIIGVTSYGMAYCLSAGFYTRIDLYTPFIDKAVSDAGGGGGGGGCVPNCRGKQCGDDGCGGQCPSQCQPTEVCSPQNTCVPGNTGGGCPNETEGNETVATANALCSGDTIDGKLNSGNDVDYYKFDVPANSYYTVLLDNASANYSVAVFKQGKNGVLTIGNGKPAGDNVVLAKRTTTGGTYYIKVSAVDPSKVDTSKTYSLYYISNQ